MQASRTQFRLFPGWRLPLLWLLLLAAYSNSFQGGLVFDSAKLITQDARIRAATAQNLQRIATTEYWFGSAPSGLYRPLTTLSFLWNYAVLGGGEDPQGYHRVNFALHVVNVSLVYLLGVAVLGESTWALAFALLWGLHPILTECVSNIAGRADLLAALGVLAGLLCYIRSTAAAGRRRVAWIAGLAAAQAVGLFSKENAAVLPGLLLLYDFAWSKRADWRARIPAYIALAAPFALFLLLRARCGTVMHIDPAENPLASAGFWAARFTAVKALGKAVGLFLWPARLSADYSYNAIPLATWSPVDLAALLSLLGCLAAVALAFRWRATRKPLFFFTGFFLLAWLPTSNLIFLIGSIMAERFVYLPAAGLAGCAVAALQHIPRRAAWAILGMLALACGARTYARNADWRDEGTFWAATVKACPDSARPHNNLGDTLSRVPGRLPDAIAEFQIALRIRPDYADAHYNLGNALAVAPATLPQAILEYQAALRIEPGFARARLNLGTALAQAPGRLPEAIEQFEAAAKADPDMADAHYDLGSALAQIPGRLPDALRELQTSVRMEPGNARAHNNLGSLLMQVPGRLPEAIGEFQIALRLQPEYLRAHLNLGSALTQTPGRLAEAIAEFETAQKIQPDPEIARLLVRLRAAQPGSAN